MDGFWEDELAIWDTAAGVLLVKEAGGFVTDYRGGDRPFERGEYVAASGAIHSKLQKLVAGAVRE
jgi:myo-inositol-1(or 4)-monophosphatase